jgi:hypothetical protein
MSTLIPLSQNRFSVVDDEDAPTVLAHKWTFLNTGRGYAVRRSHTPDGHPTMELLHRVLLDAAKGVEVDHIDGDSLNNQRANLRICSHQENRSNTRKHKDNTSGFKGVSWSKAAKKWTARLCNKHLGVFLTKEDAARAYNTTASERFGKFACLNVLPKHSSEAEDR